MTTRHLNIKKVQVLQMIAIVLLLSLLVAILVAEGVRTSRNVTRETALPATVNGTIRGGAYVVRDEAVISVSGAGPVRYALPEGGAVRQYDPVLTAYPSEGDATKREQAGTLLTEIEALRTLADAAEFSPAEYEAAYLALMRDLTTRQTAADSAKDRLLTSLATLGGKPDAAALDAEIAKREDAFDELVRLVADRAEQKTAPVAGYLYRTADGLETLLTPDLAGTLTPAGLSALLASPQSTADAVGKVAGEAFSLLLPLTHAEADALTVGEVYFVTLHDAGATLSLTLSGLTRDEGGALAHLTGGDASAVRLSARRQQVTLIAATHTGLRVPVTALREENGTLYVFIEQAGAAAKRQIAPLLYENGYCLSDPAAGEGYLSEGDAVLVTGRRLYEGKTVK